MNLKIHSAVVIVFLCLQSVCLINTNEILRVNNLKNSVTPSILASFTTGIQLAMEHCKKAFKWDRWNCPETAFTRRNTLLTKEEAYVRAITSAAIVHSITRNCSRGEIESCGCSTNFIPDKAYQELFTTPYRGEDGQITRWSWGGCSDDTVYAEKVVSQLFGMSEIQGTIRNMFEDHNDQVGRQIVKDTMVKKCRCHGISNSCSLQTCWIQVAPFGMIAHRLKEHYRRAVHISYDVLNGGNRVMHNSEEKEISTDSKSMIYMDESPNYCLKDPLKGWPGTKGRSCTKKQLNQTSITLEEKRSCRTLCRSCGHRVRRKRKTVLTNCNCKFIWCCEVECDTCQQVVDEYFCA